MTHHLFAQGRLVSAKKREAFLRFGRLAERREASKVAEDDRDLPAMTGKERLAFARRDQLRDLG